MFEDHGDMNDFMASFHRSAKDEDFPSSGFGALGAEIAKRIAEIEKMKLLLDSYKYGDRLIQEQERIAGILDQYNDPEHDAEYEHRYTAHSFYVEYQNHLTYCLNSLRKTINRCRTDMKRDESF